MVFYVLFLSLSITFSWFICLVASSGMYQYFIHFYGWIIFYWMDRPLLFIHSSVNGHLFFPHHLATVNSVFLIAKLIKLLMHTFYYAIYWWVINRRSEKNNSEASQVYNMYPHWTLLQSAELSTLYSVYQGILGRAAMACIYEAIHPRNIYWKSSVYQAQLLILYVCLWLPKTDLQPLP